MRDLTTTTNHSVMPHEGIAVGHDYLQGDRVYQGGDYRFYLNILRRRKWYIIVPLLIIMPLTVLNLAVQKPVYEAQSTILIENDLPQVLNIQEVLAPDHSKDFYLTEYGLIKTRENIAEVVDVLKLDQRPPVEESDVEKTINAIINFPGKIKQALKSMIPSDTTPTNGTPVDPAELHRQEIIDQVAELLQVKPREDTKLVNISISGENAHDVAQQVNTLVDVYMQKNLEKKLKASRQAITWLQREIAELKEKTQKTDLALQDFKVKKNLISFDFEDKQNIDFSRLNHLHSEHTKTNAELIDLGTQLTNLKRLSNRYNLEEGLNVLSNMIDSRLIEDWKRKYTDAKNQYIENSKKYQKKHPIMVQIRSQIDGIRADIDTELQRIIQAKQEQYNVLRAKQAGLETELGEQQNQTLRVGNDLFTYSALKRDAENQRNLYLEATKRLREIELTQALATNNITVVQKAEVPREPVPSKHAITLVLSVILGCSLGVGLAFIREYVDPRFKGTDEIEPYLRIPFLGGIPHVATVRRRPYEPVTLYDPASMASEAYRMIRTRLQAASPHLNTLLLTSALQSEGKSTTTVNLGITFAHVGKRVLLVDTDLRRPSLHRHFQLKGNVGLTDILMHGADWRQTIQDTPIDRLKLLATGIVQHHPSDVLSLKAMRKLIDQFRSAFDLVMFDSPLVLSVPDVEILAPAMDGTLLVHSPGASEKENVLEATRLLERAGAKILGLIFNNISTNEQKYYYKYKQRYYSYENGNQLIEYREFSDDRNPTFQNEETTQNIPQDIKHNDSYVSININQTLRKKEIFDQRSVDGKMFLIIDLDILNHSEQDHSFHPEFTAISLEKQSKYSDALAKLYNFESELNLEWQDENFYRYDAITERMPNGIAKELLIAPYERTRGLLVYQVPEGMEHCIFMYEAENTSIAMPLAISGIA